MEKSNSLQQRALCEFMKDHPQLAKNSKMSLNGRQLQKNLWMELVEKLNALGPPIKTEAGWRKTWSIKKYNVKKNLAHNKSSMKKTGGGPPDLVSIDDISEMVIEAAGLESAVEGIEGDVFGMADDQSLTQLSHPEDPEIESIPDLTPFTFTATVQTTQLPGPTPSTSVVTVQKTQLPGSTPSTSAVTVQKTQLPGSTPSTSAVTVQKTQLPGLTPSTSTASIQKMQPSQYQKKAKKSAAQALSPKEERSQYIEDQKCFHDQILQKLDDIHTQMTLQTDLKKRKIEIEEEKLRILKERNY